jgi:hydrogenase-4 component B
MNCKAGLYGSLLMNTLVAFLGFPLLLVSAAISAFALSQKKSVSDKAMSVALCLLALLSAFAAFVKSDQVITFATSAPFLLGVFPLTFMLDGLSRLFLAILCLILLSIGFFSAGYLSHLKERISGGLYWISFFLFSLSMFGVVLSADAITFLVMWEIMSLSSAALVATDHTHHSVQKSALIYLGATRIASGLLCGGFLWMHSLCGSWSFSDWSFAQPHTVFPALLIFLGFCIKAGVWPFHIWLPYAHPAAPATVSAAMSGFMIKIPIYGLIRILIQGGLDSAALINLAFILGAISSFWGVLFALVQNDLKRLLAYSSIENVGLIFLSLAISLKARVANLPLVADMAMTAALFHCLNHGVIKSLLFLCVGSVDAQTHSRDLHKLGGLAKRMPWTMACFFIGSFSICSIPPLNGFASKWLIYESLFKGTLLLDAYLDRGLFLVAICLLSAVGALAIAVFVKAMGVGFLGMSRSRAAEHAQEASTAMRISQAFLAMLSVSLGVFAAIAMNQITKLVAVSNKPVILEAVNFPVPTSLLASMLVVLGLAVYLAVLQNSKVRTFKTWDCGFGPLSSKTQVSSDSFAQPLARIFRPFLRYETNSNISGSDKRHFPQEISVEVKIVSILESRVYLPSLAVISFLARGLAKLQAGSIHLYLLYVCSTLVFLLLIGAVL